MKNDKLIFRCLPQSRRFVEISTVFGWKPERTWSSR